jgi:hypothetical protein
VLSSGAQQAAAALIFVRARHPKKRRHSWRKSYGSSMYYRQLHGNRIYALEQELHNLRARNWRLDAELSQLHRGNDWAAAARLVRDEVSKIIADPKCSRRQLRAGLDAVVESIRVSGLKS